MHNGQNRDFRLVNDIKDAVGKSPQESASDIAINDRVKLWRSLDLFERMLDAQ